MTAFGFVGSIRFFFFLGGGRCFGGFFGCGVCFFWGGGVLGGFGRCLMFFPGFA